MDRKARHGSCSVTPWPRRTACGTPQLKPFAERYRVLRYDQRGHGQTDGPPGPYSLELLADDVLALLDELSIERVHFVGLSMGGMTGLTLALRRPGVLRSLVLCDTASEDPIGAALWDARIEAVHSSESTEFLVEPTLARFLTPHTVTTRPQLADLLHQSVRTAPLGGYVGCCRVISQYNLTDRLPEITVPTMIVVGSDDLVTTVAMAEVLHRGVADSELVILSDAAHLSNLDQPDGFNMTVLGFLARH